MTIILLGYSLSGQALDAPEMDCVEVLENGDTFFTWDAPNDPNGEFVSYEVYASSDEFESAANLVATIPNYNDIFFDHIGGDANSSSLCYYILVNSNDGSPQVSSSSDTICSIFITAEPSVSPLGYAVIDITGPYQFQDPAAGLQYQIWLNYPTGTWNLIDQIPVEEDEYSYEVDVCEAYYEFQVTLIDENGCNIRSNIAGNNFVDQIPPPTPEVLYVSVDSTTLDIDIEWQGANFPDTQGYIVYQCLDGGLSVPVDTIYGAANQQYTYETTFGGISGGIQFTVAAFDFCGDVDDFSNISPAGSICHQSIFLENPSWFTCQDFVNLHWTHYEGWEEDGGVYQYEILFKVDGGPEQSAGFVDGFTQDFLHTDLLLGSIYRYYIKGYSYFGIAESLSNSQTQNLNSDTPPDHAYILSASVVSDEEVEVTVRTTFFSFPHLFILERDNPLLGIWDFVDSQYVNGDLEVNFSDPDADVCDFVYNYRIVVLNDCQDTVQVSNAGTTMLLQGIENSANVSNTLTWTSYGDWESGVQQYVLHRSQEKGVLGTIIDINAPNDLNYEDDIETIEVGNTGWYCYTVEAIETPGNITGLQGKAFSNQKCLQLSPLIWVPNAFMINGFNNTFKPVLNAVDYNTYLMKIYSRWGDTIFVSEHPDVGWDGTKNGTLLQEGQYGFYISVKDGQGRLYEEKGAFLMLIAD